MRFRDGPQIHSLTHSLTRSLQGRTEAEINKYTLQGATKEGGRGRLKYLHNTMALLCGTFYFSLYCLLIHTIWEPKGFQLFIA